MHAPDPTAGESDTAAETLAEALARIRERLQRMEPSRDSNPPLLPGLEALRPMIDTVDELNRQLTAVAVAQDNAQAPGAILARVQMSTMLHGCRYWLDVMELQFRFLASHAPPDASAPPDMLADPAFVDELGRHLQQITAAWDRHMLRFHEELEGLLDGYRDFVARNAGDDSEQG